MQQGRADDALALVEAALPDDVPPDLPTRRHLAMIRAGALRVRGDADAAIDAVDRVLPTLSASDQPPLRLIRAQALADRGDRAGADDAFRELLSELPTIRGGDELLVDLATIAAQSLWDDGATPFAEPWLRRAVAARDGVGADVDRLEDAVALRGVRPEIDVQLARVEGRAGRHRGAVLHGENGKAAVLSRLGATTGVSTPVVDDVVRRDLVATLAAVSAEEHDSAARLARMSAGEPERAALAAAVRVAQDRRRSLTGQLELRLGGRVQVPRALPPLDDRLDALVGTGAAVVSLTLGVDGLGVAGVGPAGEAGVYAQHPTFDELIERVVLPLGAARAGLSRGRVGPWHAALERALADLHDAVGRDVREVAERVGGSHLVLAPHRVLHGLPLAAAAGPDGRALIDDLGPVSVLPALAFYDPAAPVGPATRTPLVVGRPDQRAPLMGLEAAAVALALGGAQMLLGDAATPLAVAGAAIGAPVIHLAVHGTYQPGVPSRSGVHLAPGGPDVFGTGSGLLSPGAAAPLLGVESAHLVVLSACDSGLGDPSVTDDRTGLPGVLLARGAGWVVASLWPVSDLVTLALVRRLYAELPVRSVPGALALAQAWLRVASRNDIVESLDDLRGLAESTGAGDVLAAASQRFAAAKEPVGPDGWAAFCAFGAPRPGEGTWPDDG